jgi:hypothetical protein
MSPDGTRQNLVLFAPKLYWHLRKQVKQLISDYCGVIRSRLSLADAHSASIPDYAGHRFPAEIISYEVWLYSRFPLSLRMVEEMLAARGISVPWRRSARGLGREKGTGRPRTGGR